MSKLLPRSITGFFLLVCACSDTQPTRPDATRQVTTPGGQSLDVTPLLDAPTPPADMNISGNAQGCFGDGCTPAENVTLNVLGTTIVYASRVPPDFFGRTANGLLAVNDAQGVLPVGNFGVITALGTGQPIALSIPFTLRLTFFAPTAGPVSVAATLRGTLSFDGSGGLVLTFDDKKTLGSESIKIDFTIPSTGATGRMDLTLFGEPVPSSRSAVIGGLFEVR